MFAATEVKICGLRDEAGLDAAIAAGAGWIGLVFFPRSPRHVSLETGARLAARARGRLGVVALTVDADDALLSAISETVRPDLLQLHGAETPERVAEVRRLTGLPVMKAVGVGDAADLRRAQAYAAAADRLLLDAKPPKDATRPGGNGAAFDWTLLAGFDPGRPWMLSGGLRPDTVVDALRVSAAAAVDVSSGVERAPGDKDPDLIRRFVSAVRAHDARARAA